MVTEHATHDSAADGRSAGSTTEELFQRLDVLGVLLSENADRWLLASSSATTARILDERSALQREQCMVERELRRRSSADRSAEDRASGYEQEAVVQELAASFFEERGFHRAAARHRHWADLLTGFAEREREAPSSRR